MATSTRYNPWRSLGKALAPLAWTAAAEVVAFVQPFVDKRLVGTIAAPLTVFVWRAVANYIKHRRDGEVVP
jgi:hypothetical protein